MQTSLCLLWSQYSQAHQQTAIGWSKSPSATTSPSSLQAADTGPGICPTCPAAHASYPGLPLEPPKSIHIPATTKPTRDVCRKVPDPTNPPEEPGADLPRSAASTAEHPRALTSRTDALAFGTAVFIAAPGYYITKRPISHTHTKPKPKEMHRVCQTPQAVFVSWLSSASCRKRKWFGGRYSFFFFFPK